MFAVPGDLVLVIPIHVYNSLFCNSPATPVRTGGSRRFCRHGDETGHREETPEELAPLTRRDVTLEDTAPTIRAHPTLSASAMEAVENVCGYAIHTKLVRLDANWYAWTTD